MKHPKNFCIKTSFRVAIASLGASCAAYAGPEPFSETFIPAALDVPAFVPPKPVEPKRLPSIRIDSSVSVPSAGSRTLTIQRGEASTLPDLPPPPEPAPPQPAWKPTAEQLARQLYQWRHSIHLGATVYNHKVSEVRWNDQETRTNYRAVCGFDIGLIAGVGKYVHDGETYAVDLMHSDFNIPPNGRSAARVPQIANGEIRTVEGDSQNAGAIQQLYFIRDLISAEKAYSGFLEAPDGSDSTITSYRGYIQQARFRVIATRVSHEPLNRRFLKVEGKAPYGERDVLIPDSPIPRSKPIRVNGTTDSNGISRLKFSSVQTPE